MAMNLTLRRFSFQAMGSYCEVQIYAESRIHARNLTRQLVAEVQRLESKYSRFKNDSFVSAINQSAGNRAGLHLDPETLTLFEHALTCYEQSDGLFDITAGALNRIWDFKTSRVPTQAEIDAVLPLVGLHKLQWRGGRLRMPADMSVDFGGIVKEYAADTVANLARRLGAQHGLVNLGGDFAVIGPQPGDRPWAVGILNPKAPDALMAKIDISAGGLASSGDYERCFVHDGKRYSHILNPKTGWPNSALRAVSVAANLCTVAGSIATIAMLREEALGISGLQESGLPHVYMTNAEAVAGAGLSDPLLHEA